MFLKTASRFARAFMLLSACLALLFIPKPNIHAAPTGQSLSLALRCTKANLQVGDEIPIEFIITNQGDTDYAYADRNYDRSGRMGEYELIAKNTAGETMTDPRASYLGGISGGLHSPKNLPPGGFFTRTIDLNRWVLIRTPGRYRITGVYRTEGNQKIESAPITIIVKPRSEADMETYIKSLSAKLNASKAREDRDEIIKKLMYTGSPKIVPLLLDLMYERDSGFWEAEALLYYVPHSDEIKQAILQTAANRGLGQSMQYVLAHYDVTPDEMYPLIERSLAPENPQAWANGALAAQVYASDTFTSRLITLATDPNSGARDQAIYALALNRTDESVKTLKTLLEDADEAIRKTVARAIQVAYRARGISRGRPLRDEDFDESFRQSQ